MRILVVEDEPRMAELLRKGLTEEGHVITVASEGVDGMSLAEEASFDLLLLDVMLPGQDGMSILRRLRSTHVQTPVIMLTARDATRDVVEGLNAGADDYITKPFAFEELIARVRAAGRRGPATVPLLLQVGDLVLNQGTRELKRGARSIALTRTEYAILELLMRNPGRVIPRDNLMSAVWGVSRDVENNTLDAFIRLLRSKLEAPDEPRLLHTVRGVGYVLRSEE